MSRGITAHAIPEGEITVKIHDGPDVAVTCVDYETPDRSYGQYDTGYWCYTVDSESEEPDFFISAVDGTAYAMLEPGGEYTVPVGYCAALLLVPTT